MDLEFQTISSLQTTPFWRSREPGHHDVVFSHIQFLLQALCPQVNAALLAFTLGGTQFVHGKRRIYRHAKRY